MTFGAHPGHDRAGTLVDLVRGIDSQPLQLP
jgi:hypothetical protein